ncbi:DNA polymerase III subunit gamma and tau [Arthrobacter sp. H14-L1]|nr:DNA polymerase III subunit gamma and tau [Arthrobacter sp. H14-L1]MCY0904060.1 DNA polymerase III subunit gamma and tau [Arthrobacter sp. H14-L1]
MTAPTALYRRYRPDSFADVIGQEHVTEPLMAALQKNRVNHAYLFSGPRGCGKTTSARILARCLNCAQGPTAIPCGKCDSCIELARGGSGSLDVIEIDAASHGGVDDARDLRERATFAPVRDRYKIFIIDEAHMVTSAGFNALLKIVEEPPEHIKFIFATTEPDKVIGTIRSRTHHYPFRLVPPEPLMEYLGLLCRQENVPVAPGVLSLVIRAGGGSVRDSLSVLDQLMAGAGPAGLDYELAVSLLGYTHASLLDDVVDALAASDAGTVFRAVDRVIQTGHDPRRFVEDLLERFRDLIIVRAMPESAHAVLRGMPEDQIARMQTQSTQLGAAELSRAADVTNTALTEMTGATSPRLHLELLSARLLLPGADQSERGMGARLDRIERRLSYGGADTLPAVESATADGKPAGSAAASGPAVSGDTPSSGAAEERRGSAQTKPEPSPQDTHSVPAPVSPSPLAPAQSGRPPSNSAASSSESGADSAPAAQHAPAASGATGVEVLRRAWPEILDNLTKVKRSSWALVAPNATPQTFDGEVLQLSFSTAGLAGAFSRGDHADNLRAAIHKTLGMNCRINAVAGDSSSAGSSAEPDPKAPTSRAVPAGRPPAAMTAANPATPAGATGATGTGGTADAARTAGSGGTADAAGARAMRSDASSRTPDEASEDAPKTNSVISSWGYEQEEPPPHDEEPAPEWGAPEAARPDFLSRAAADSRPPASQRPGQQPGQRAGQRAGQQSDHRPAEPVDPGWGAIADAPDWAAPVPASISLPATGTAGGAPTGSANVWAADQSVPAVLPTSSSTSAADAVAVKPKMSLYERLKNSPEAQAGRVAAPQRKVDLPYVEDIPSADDETIETSQLVGRAAVERILGGRLVEERSLGGS